MALDPLGLKRCVTCTNAFENEKDEHETEKWIADGLIEPSEFICRSCARIDATKR
jgi:hypothetical protein